jgi:hypothetical protein
MVTEEQVAAVTAKLMQWSATLPEQEQAALANILRSATQNDDTQGQIIIVGGVGLAPPAIVRSGVFAGIRPDRVETVSSGPFWTTTEGLSPSMREGLER